MRRSNRRGRDRFSDRAQKEGYPARSVYKLEEIDRRLGLLRRGQRCLDLGASPGSWSLYAAERVGERGKVLAIDLNEAKTQFPPQVDYRVADAFAANAEELVAEGRFDVVLSDMAPSTTGKRDLDQYRSYELFMRALNLSIEVLRPGGSFVGKIFQGPDFEAARKEVAQHFEQARILRPKATRDVSYEVFLVGTRARA